MESKKISPTEWERALGVHRLFAKVTDSVINNYRKTTPPELVDIILNDPYGTACDAITTVYPDVCTGAGYSVRMHAFKGEVNFSTELKTMVKGEGAFLSRCLTLKEPTLISDISGELTDGDRASLPWIDRVRTALVIPTISVTGAPAMTVLFAEAVDGFDAETVNRNIFLTHATTNIILTWLHRVESVTACEALDEELATLGHVQRALLPEGLPETEDFSWATYYSTSTRAGGDYYDFFPLENGRTGTIIADVSGHGSPAAITMAMTRLLLHTYPGEALPPAEVLSNVNKLLAGNLLPGHFVTAFYAVLSPDGTLSCSNAGHCPPLLYRAVTGKVEEVNAGSGLPLGVVSAGNFRESAVQVAPGDVLLLYTDGLMEATNDSGEMYGDEGRLKAAFKEAADKDPDGIKEHLLAGLNSFIGDEPIKDDLTFIVLKSGAR